MQIKNLQVDMTNTVLPDHWSKFQKLYNPRETLGEIPQGLRLRTTQRALMSCKSAQEIYVFNRLYENTLRTEAVKESVEVMDGYVRRIENNVMTSLPSRSLLERPLDMAVTACFPDSYGFEPEPLLMTMTGLTIVAIREQTPQRKAPIFPEPNHAPDDVVIWQRP